MHHAISYFAQSDGRPPTCTFGIKAADRALHCYALGKTGAGKSTLLETLAHQDIEAGRGLAFIDPHGDLADRLAAYAKVARHGDLVYLNAPDGSQPYGYNPLRAVAKDRIPLAASGLLEAFKKHWGEKAWGVRMEHVLRNALYALLECGDATLPDILRLLSDKDFRKDVARRISNKQVKQFWQEEYPQYSWRYRADAIAPIQNKVGAFLADPVLYRLLTAPPIDLRIRRLMDEGKILIVNLAKGRMGEDSASLLGALLVTTVGLAAFSRADTPEEQRTPFFLYMDEFQSFTTLAVANMVSELRKFKVALVCANQGLYQLEPDVRHAMLGNVGTLVAFRLGPEDASMISREFAPDVEPDDLVNLPNYTIYLKLMIDGAPSRPFRARTIRTEDVDLRKAA